MDEIVFNDTVVDAIKKKVVMFGEKHFVSVYSSTRIWYNLEYILCWRTVFYGTIYDALTNKFKKKKLSRPSSWRIKEPGRTDSALDVALTRIFTNSSEFGIPGQRYHVMVELKRLVRLCTAFFTFLFGAIYIRVFTNVDSSLGTWITNVTLYQGNSCVKRRQVAYVKVHKASSTTITSILQRYGVTHNLTFALPKQDLYHIDFFGTLHPEKVFPIRKGATYDILCQHVVYNREAFRKYLPSEIAVIASVREPLERFLSTFYFFVEYQNSIRAITKKNLTDLDQLKEYIKFPDKYEPVSFKNGSLVRNRMSFDLGIPKEKFFDADFVEDYIKMLDKNLEFVLMTENFDESLVILKRRFCWSTKDILYQVRNHGRSKVPSIPSEVKKQIKDMLRPDYQIYDFFRKKFYRIASAEKSLFEEVRLFRKILQNVREFCKTKAKTRLNVTPTRFDAGFTFSKADCFRMNLEEKTYLERLIENQSP